MRSASPGDSRARSALARLARAAGIESGYVDGLGRQREAGDESVHATLAALGVDASLPINEALIAIKKARGESNVEPVCVTWQGRSGGLWLDLPSAKSNRAIRGQLDFEEGGAVTWINTPRGRRTRASKSSVAGHTRVEIRLPDRMPFGAHALILEAGGVEYRSTVLSAPRRCDVNAKRAWGVFVPLYALRSRRNWGIGDFSDFRALTRWASEASCSFVGTLPILASFLDRPFDPSPYAPVSRLFWNELFLDLESAPELAHSPAARRMLASPSLRQTLSRLRRSPRVDYRAAYALKRRVLDMLAPAAFARPQRRAVIEAFRARQPLVDDYALFRAAVERHGRCPFEWSADATQLDRATRGTDPKAARTHLYAQFLAAEQLAAVQADATDDCAVYLDFPLGVHGAGFDTWRFRDAFVPGLSVGAPPDALSADGQNWGFPPMHPWRTRRDGHAYFRACLRFLFRQARVLRIDHVMGLHRLFCFAPHCEGLYVSQPHEELYAALCIEAYRAGAMVVGENLGTVPDAVHRTIKRRGLLGMDVAQFSFKPDRASAIPMPPCDTLACLNTHDTPTFTAFWNGDDIADRLKRKLIDTRAAAADRAGLERTRLAVARHLRTLGLIDKSRPTTDDVLTALLRFQASTPAKLTLVNMEDLWGERRPQNSPGLCDPKRNWCNKAARSLEEIIGDARLADLMRELSARRSGKVGSAHAKSSPRAKRTQRIPAGVRRK